MKKPLHLMILMLVLAISAQAQEAVTMTFTAAKETGDYSPFTSVLVTDLTQGWSTSLAYPDTVLTLSQPNVGVEDWNGLSMGTAYPNPFATMTSVPFELTETSPVTLQVFRTDGTVVASRDIYLDPGSHNATVHLSTPGLAFLSVATPHGRSVARLVCTGHGAVDAVDVECAAANTLTRGDAPGAFMPGDLMRYEAFLSTGGTTYHSAVVEQTQYTSETVTLFFPVEAPVGAIDGLFTINEEGGKVYFSQGNLKYNLTTGIWSFMEHQYSTVENMGQDVGTNYYNQNIVSLFGWSTSGYDHGAGCYQPWSTSTTCEYYYAYGNAMLNLYDETGQADWGYNAIENGGNIENRWRTLTSQEWNYIFNTRVTASGIRFVKAQLNGMSGVILLPDDWNGGYFSLNYPNTSNVYFDCNTLTLEQWASIEGHGAVFLPAAGYRLGTEIFNKGNSGHYWSSSHNYNDRAYCISLFDSGVYPQAIDFIFNGFSVRLVQDAH